MALESISVSQAMFVRANLIFSGVLRHPFKVLFIL